MIVWPGLFMAAMAAPVVVLALNWSNTASLARRHAIRALVVVSAVFLVQVPTLLWTFVFRGPPYAYWLAWATTSSTLVVVAIVSFVQAFRAPVTAGGRP
jgi:hypothetical protein